MRRFSTLALALVPMTFAFAAPAMADGWDDAPGRSIIKPRVELRSLTDLIAEVRTANPGFTIYDVNLDYERTRWIYKISMVAANGLDNRKITVSALAGAPSTPSRTRNSTSDSKKLTAILALLPSATVDFPAAITAAEALVANSKAVEINLAVRNGVLVYKVDVTGGVRTREVRVNAVTGVATLDGDDDDDNGGGGSGGGSSGGGSSGGGSSGGGSSGGGGSGGGGSGGGAIATTAQGTQDSVTAALGAVSGGTFFEVERKSQANRGTFNEVKIIPPNFSGSVTEVKVNDAGVVISRETKRLSVADAGRVRGVLAAIANASSVVSVGQAVTAAIGSSTTAVPAEAEFSFENGTLVYEVKTKVGNRLVKSTVSLDGTVIRQR